ncbi:COP9 signalosome, subunit CSN8 [Wolffia australiana]
MDLSPIREALASKSYDKIGDICDDLMLKIAAYQGVEILDEWPYAVHLLGHIYANDLNSARFLWKSLPPVVKERNQEILAVWKIGQCLWTRDRAGVYNAIREFRWSPEILDFVTAFAEIHQQRMFHLLQSGYSTISVADTAQFLGMSEEMAINYTIREGWALDGATRMLTVRKKSTVSKQKVDPGKLQRLTEFVFHLEH